MIEHLWEKVTGSPYRTVRVMSEEFGPPLTVVHRALLDQVSDREWMVAPDVHLADFIRRIQAEKAAGGVALFDAITEIRRASGLELAVAGVRRELPAGGRMSQ